MSSLIIFPSFRSDVPHLECGSQREPLSLLWGQVPFLLKGVVWEHAQTHQETTDNGQEHFRSALRRKGVPTPSRLRAWEDTNSADYCAFKEKGGAPWDVPARETLSWWTLLWGCRPSGSYSGKDWFNTYIWIVPWNSGYITGLCRKKVEQEGVPGPQE